MTARERPHQFRYSWAKPRSHFRSVFLSVPVYLIGPPYAWIVMIMIRSCGDKSLWRQFSLTWFFSFAYEPRVPAAAQRREVVSSASAGSYLEGRLPRKPVPVGLIISLSVPL